MEIGFYKRLYVEKRALNMKFTQADMKNRVFRAEDNGVSIVLPMSDAFFGVKKEEYPARAARFIGKYEQVLVSEVDEASGIVTVSKSELHRKHLKEERERIQKEIAAGNKVITKARIIGIYGKGKSSFALVRLLDCGLRGAVWCEDWSVEYTTDISDVAKVGEVIDVAVMEVNNSKSAESAEYRCSRMDTLENPWSGVESKLHKGDIVNAKILTKWNGGFSGKLEGFKDITAWVAIPDKEKLRLVSGLIYQCEIIAVNETKKTLKLRPFRLCYVD